MDAAAFATAGKKPASGTAPRGPGALLREDAAHLSFGDRVNRGSFYTPERYVGLVGEWLVKHGVAADCVFLEPSCGYGAFFSLLGTFPGARFLGNDVDPEAVAVAKARFPSVSFSVSNVLHGVNRAKFGIGPGERLCVIGNPPWNDVTSQIRQSLKTARAPMDPDVASRDLGLSSLLAYDKLAADFVAVLHPLSYLVKRPNFNAARRFFGNYRLEECLVFDSRNFAATSRSGSFPVVVALYVRAPGAGLCRADVLERRFTTEEGDSFRLSDRDYIDSFVDKYPGTARYDPEILFYTMRDVNALGRSRTFLPGRCAGAVDVNPAKLDWYCYVDAFKAIATTPYWMGNFSVPLVAADFPSVAPAFRSIALHRHPEVFGPRPAPSAAELETASDYIRSVVSFKKNI